MHIDPISGKPIQSTTPEEMGVLSYAEISQDKVSVSQNIPPTAESILSEVPQLPPPETHASWMEVITDTLYKMMREARKGDVDFLHRRKEFSQNNLQLYEALIEVMEDTKYDPNVPIWGWLPLANLVGLYSQSYKKFIDGMNDLLVPNLILHLQGNQEQLSNDEKKNLAEFASSFLGNVSFSGILGNPNHQLSQAELIKVILENEEKNLEGDLALQPSLISENVDRSLGFLLNSTAILSVRDVLGNFGSSLPVLQEGSITHSIAYGLGFVQQVHQLISSDSIQIMIQQTVERLPVFLSLSPSTKDVLIKSLTNFTILSLTTETLAVLRLFTSPILPLASFPILLRDQEYPFTETLKSPLTTAERLKETDQLNSSLTQFYQEEKSSPILLSAFKETLMTVHIPEKEAESLSADFLQLVRKLFAKDLSLDTKLQMLRKEIFELLVPRLGEVLARTVSSQLVIQVLHASSIEQIVEKIQEETSDVELVVFVRKALRDAFMESETVFIDTIVQMTETQDKKIAKAAALQFRHFIEEIVDPQVNIERLIEGIKESTGIMTEGIKTGFQRGDVDIPV